LIRYRSDNSAGDLLSKSDDASGENEDERREYSGART
jgi:hypothetical protein